MTKKHIVLLVTIFLAQSCSYLLENVEKENKHNFKPLSITSQISCSNPNPNFALASTIKHTPQNFKDFLNTIRKKGIYPRFIDKAMLWTLIQVNSQPATSSPTSRFQLLIANKGKRKYWDFKRSLSSIKNKQISMPLFFGIEHLLKYYKSKYSLAALAKLIDNYSTGKPIVENELKIFLKLHEKELSNNKVFKRNYFKSGEILKNGERIPKGRFSSLVKKYRKISSKKNYSISNKLFNYQIYPKKEYPQVHCNHNIKLYENSIFLVDKKQGNSNTFSIQDQKNHMIAVSGQKITRITPLENTRFFVGDANKRFASLCFFHNIFEKEGKKRDINISMSSSKSRDPGQHLFHLFSYGMNDVKNLIELKKIDQMPRHLFLTSPLRLVYESNQGNPQQLEHLLKFKFPIYHTKSLGNIWYHYQDNQENGLLIDHRHPGKISCRPASAPAPASR